MGGSSKIPWAGASGHGNFLGMKATWLVLWWVAGVAWADPWPSFRGPSATGLAPDGQHLPDTFDVETGEHVQFRVEVDGLAHSSPITWGDRLFLTTAVNQKE